MKYDVIIVGAGAAGLMATKELSAKGYNCCLLEASAVAGGRIATIQEQGFKQPVETGAEFVHGHLPLTLQLLDEAAIPYTAVKGNMTFMQNGRPVKAASYHEQFIKKAASLKQDTTLSDFLDRSFPGEKSKPLHASIRRFAEGFDLANPANASVFSLREEWSHEEEEQYRIEGGYSRLTEFLFNKCRHNKAVLQLNAAVTEIAYGKDKVTVTTHNGKVYEAGKLVLTVSAGVLQSGMIKFTPALHEHAEAIRGLGFGSVIKIMAEFKNSFWEHICPGTGFFLSNEPIPTWWTQLPVRNNLLTGWLGGPSASAFSSSREEDVLQTCIASLSALFNRAEQTIKKELLHHKIICWQNHPYVKGGYSYSTLHSAAAKKILSQPVQDKLFFAGEAVWQGKSRGTVEAALQSGLAVSKMIQQE